VQAFELRERTKYDWKEGDVSVGGFGYTWSIQGSIDELVARAEKREKENKLYEIKTNERWQDVLRRDDDPEHQACVICSL